MACKSISNCFKCMGGTVVHKHKCYYYLVFSVAQEHWNTLREAEGFESESEEEAKPPALYPTAQVNRTQSGHRSGAKPISYCTRDTDCPVFITNCTIFSFHPPPWFANHNGIDLFSSSDRHNMQRIVPRSKYTHANQTFPSNDDLPSMLVSGHRLLHAHEQCHVFQAL
jgi:hypothetical protein